MGTTTQKFAFSPQFSSDILIKVNKKLYHHYTP